MFTEIYCMKYPDRSIKLLQYSGHLNNLVGKFPFDQVYAYDKEFRADLEWFPDKPWDQIDQQLWSLTLHGIYTMPHQGNPQQCQFRKQQLQQQGWKASQTKAPDNQYRNCFDHNRGGCSRPSCIFPHICGRCGSPAHTTPFCPQQKQQQQGSTAATTTQSNPSAGRRNVRPTNATQAQPAQRDTQQVSRQ